MILTIYIDRKIACIYCICVYNELVIFETNSYDYRGHYNNVQLKIRNWLLHCNVYTFQQLRKMRPFTFVF